MQKHGKPETEASTPQKTVRVLDEAGNEYEATYPKRAKGLVKHGRARFTDDSQTVIILREPLNTHRTENQRNLFRHTSQKSFAEDELCARTFASPDEKSSCCFPHAEYSEVPLACPPNQHMILEDNTMNEQINHTEVTENTAAEAYTYEYALKQIELLTRQVDHIHLAISELGHLENEGTPCGGSAKSVAEGIADVVRCRETTAQKLIDFYAKMYEDLKPRSQAQAANRVEFMEWVRSCIAASEPGIDLPDFERLWKIFN